MVVAHERALETVFREINGCLRSGRLQEVVAMRELTVVNGQHDFFGTYPDTLIVDELIFPSGFEILTVPCGEDFSLQNEQINKQDMSLY